MYLTKSIIRNYSGLETTQKAVLTYTDRNSSSFKAQVFLSHSHVDVKDLSKDEVIALIRILIALSYDVYIDWLDPDMPPETNEETANRLKGKIDECDRFLLVATTNAVNSRWVPWELGYADKSKSIDNIAVIPIADSSGKWEGAEYLRLYRQVLITTDNYLAVFPPAATKNGSVIGYWMAYGK
jgi:hypothetical protein